MGKPVAATCLCPFSGNHPRRCHQDEGEMNAKEHVTPGKGQSEFELKNQPSR